MVEILAKSPFEGVFKRPKLRTKLRPNYILTNVLGWCSVKSCKVVQNSALVLINLEIKELELTASMLVS